MPTHMFNGERVLTASNNDGCGHAAGWGCVSGLASMYTRDQ